MAYATSAQSTEGRTLTLFRNEDTALERPFVVTIPVSVDTLAELCEFLTTKIPVHANVGEAPRGYRFLYSLRGKPLWRVKECMEARTLVISVGPGFLARRPQALADAAFAEVTARSQPDPDAIRTHSDKETSNDTQNLTCASAMCDAASAASASPPVRPPASNTETTAVYGAEESSPLPTINPQEARVDAVDPLRSPPSAPSTGHTDDGTALLFSAYSNNGYPTTASSERAAQYRVSITRPRGVSAEEQNGEAQHRSGAIMHAEEEEEERSVTPVPRPTKRLFTASEEAAASLSEPTTSMAHHAQSTPPSRERPTAKPTAAESAATSSASAARGQFYVKGRLYQLPPAPTFITRDISDQLCEYVESDETFIHRLRLLLVRKNIAAGYLKQRDEREVLCRAAFAALHERIMDQLTPQSARSVCRVVVEGPAHSGVSTTAALLAESSLSEFARHRQFFNHLLFPLDLATVLAGASMTGQGTGPLDLRLLYSVVVGALMDAVVAQRPALRQHSVLLFELWEKVCTRLPDTEAPNFLDYEQVVALVGFKIVSRWSALVQRVFPLLKAACADPTASTLRDAALDAIFYAIPAEVAASLRFGGLLYCLDGLDYICTEEGVHDSASRTLNRRVGHADLSAALKPVWDDAHCNVIVAWPSRVPAERIFLPYTTRRVKTLGLLKLSPQEATEAGLPQRIVVTHHHRRRSYDLKMFLGAPGYLAQLLPLIRPRLLKTQLPTPAFSLAYQAVKKDQRSTPYVLELDDAAAAEALEEFEKATRGTQVV